MIDIYADDNEDAIDPVYQAKARLLNEAIQGIGMGRYQWSLFLVAGFGWFVDSVWLLLSGLILAPVLSEFSFNGPFLSLAANVGLLVSTVVWGVGCDIWGRRWSFNLTLLITGIFGLSADGAANFVSLASLIAVVGRNMPVDSAVFLDMVPSTHQYLLTVMSVWWVFSQLIVSLIAWLFIANISCDPSSVTCARKDNMGWCYLLFTLGALTLFMWGLRFFVFTLLESPRYLIGLNKDEEAVRVICKLAKRNGTKTTLTVTHLQEAQALVMEKYSCELDLAGSVYSIGQLELANRHAILSKSSVYRVGHIKALFRTQKLGWLTTLLIALRGIIRLASTLYNNFLPFILNSRDMAFGDGSLNTTYCNIRQVILSVLGIPGALLASWAVESPWVGRRGILVISSGLTGAFLLVTTTTWSSNALLGWNCAYAFNSNIMYGVLYALSPEVFPAKDRGTSNGLVSTATCIFGVIALVIALYANLKMAVPVYIAGVLIMVVGGMSLLLPYEP
ncbi:MFS general substrate transporter [Pleurotus eryngii]|uniref:MFS general substrate transporter n=1 Tax=Pleurotus eryngii TaxID=5323 RepID=A0A9P5ZQH9_PLEER|nr:MFS general substrate transporter [Pleurotus eryngii]